VLGLFERKLVYETNYCVIMAVLVLWQNLQALLVSVFLRHGKERQKYWLCILDPKLIQAFHEVILIRLTIRDHHSGCTHIPIFFRPPVVINLSIAPYRKNTAGIYIGLLYLGLSAKCSWSARLF